jgi:SAM-dependent methyltransferase
MRVLQSKLPKLQILSSEEQESDLLAGFIRRQNRSGRVLEILEAGCGNRWTINLDGVPSRLTGVDLDSAALDIRKNQQHDLDEAILGDLRIATLNDNYYDVVYNSFVLEHIQDAEKVLDNFWRWLRPGGLLILKMPDRNSVHGFITRITPFWFHVWFKRHIEKMPNAGKPGFSPYPTVYDQVVSRKGILQWCADRDAIVQGEYGARFYLDHLGMLTWPLRVFMRIAQWLSLGRLSADYNNLTFVIEKPLGDRDKSAEPVAVCADGLAQ